MLGLEEKLVGTLALAVLQFLHVLCAMFWFGSLLYMDLVLAPALMEAGADHGAAVGGVAMRMTDRVIAPAAGLTILLGILRGAAAGTVTHFGTLYSWTWLAALVLGIGLMLWGTRVSSPTAKRVMAMSPGPGFDAAVRRARSLATIEILGFLVIIVLMIAMAFE